MAAPSAIRIKNELLRWCNSFFLCGCFGIGSFFFSFFFSFFAVFFSFVLGFVLGFRFRGFGSGSNNWQSEHSSEDCVEDEIFHKKYPLKSV